MSERKRVNAKTVISFIIVAVPVILLIIAFVNSTKISTRPKAQNGFLDLSNWDLINDGSIQLDGDWEFYWKKLLEPKDFKDSLSPTPSGIIKVPNLWNDYMVGNEKLNGNGFATFKLNIKLKPIQIPIAIKIITMSNSYKLWVNDNLIASNGTVGVDKKSNKPEYRSQVVSFTNNTDQLQILVQISNFYHWKGGFWHPVKLGEYHSIQHERDLRVILEIFLFGCLFIMAVYHFGAFSLRRSEMSVLFFGLVCLVVGLRSLFTGENIVSIMLPDLSWFAARKIEFILTFISVPAYSAFSRSLYPKEWNKFIYWLISIIGLSLCAFVLITPVNIYTFGSYIFTFYSFLSSIYIIGVFFLATIRKREGAQLFLATSLFLLFTVVNEILNQTEVVHTGLYLPVGLLIVVFAQSYILSSRSAHAFKSAEVYAKTFQKFVPKQFLDRVAKEGIESIKPGNAEKGEITVLFSDIRSFTTLSEKMSPDEVFNMLNEYLAYVEVPIRANNGFVDKYMGDGIMALFEKKENKSSSYQTIIAALQMQDALSNYNLLRIEKSKQPLEMGIGIHTGQVIIGTLGGNERMDSTAIGDAVNLCSRIEGMTKIYGVKILVSSHSLSLLDNKSEFLFRFVDFVVAKGKTEPIGIWEILGMVDNPLLTHHVAMVSEYEHGIKKYRASKISEALLHFEKCLTIFPGDPVSEIYINRCKNILTNKTTGPADFIKLEEK